MISTNPFLGPQWEPLGKAIEHILLKTQRGHTFHLQTYGRKYGSSPYTSPYLQAIISDGLFQLEVAGNLMVVPKLSEAQFRELAFYGWNVPDVDAESYSGGEENPNFHRYFALDTPVEEISEFILTTLVGVYGIVEEDFWGFDHGTDADEIGVLGLLGRLEKTEGNPNQVIFAMPGHHLNLLQGHHSDGKSV